MIFFCLLAVVAAMLFATAASAEITAQPFGKAADGTPVMSYTLKNKNGMTVKLMTLGATILEINVPDKQGKFANVCLGFDSVEGYQSDKNQYFGCTVGRVANRIAKGRFTLDGKEYKLAVNNGPNHLHGGVKRSFDKVVWNVELPKSTPQIRDMIQFTYVSPDGEEGYPGKVYAYVTYELTDSNELSIRYSAVTNQATPINLTNHSYFNLAGAGAETVLDHDLILDAEAYIPVDETLIPTGKILPVKDTVFDFTWPTRIGARIEKLYDTGAKGYDHCYVLSKRGSTPSLAAKLRDPSSGRILTVRTTQPGVQLYTGNFLSGQKGAGGKEYRQRSAVCLETSHFPDSVNHPEFPSTILRPSETYQHTCIFAFSAQ